MYISEDFIERACFKSTIHLHLNHKITRNQGIKQLCQCCLANIWLGDENKANVSTSMAYKPLKKGRWCQQWYNTIVKKIIVWYVKIECKYFTPSAFVDLKFMISASWSKQLWRSVTYSNVLFCQGNFELNALWGW